MKLTLELDSEIAVLNKYRLNPTELFLIRVLLILQEDDNQELFASYIQSLKNAGINLRNILISLQDKSIILKSYKIPEQGQEFDPYEIELNKNFVKTLYKCSFELGKDLFENYPQFASIKGNMVPLRSVARHFNSLEDAYFKYGKYIKWNPEVHAEIIELVKWAKEHNIINCSLSSFIINNGWNDLKAMKEGDCGVNYDSIKLV